MNINKPIVLILLLIAMVGIVSADTLISYAYDDATLTYDPNNDWATMHSGAGWTVVNDPSTYLEASTEATTTSNQYNFLSRGIFLVNTTLPAGATISSSKVTLWGYFKSQGLGQLSISLIDAYPAAMGPFVWGDYDGTSFNKLASDIAYADFGTSPSMVNFTMSNLTYINKTGKTPFMVALAKDVDNSAPTWSSGASSLMFYYSVAGSSGTKKPFITIEYSTGSTPPVASFTCTKNFLRIPNSVTCTDSSTNTPTSWSWNMGDGSAAKTTQNVTYQYPKRGKWGITLNATNAGGSNITPTATNVKVVGYENNY